MSIYDKASLVQIPSGYKSGTLYSVVPNTADGDFTVTGDPQGEATRVNKDGLIETVSANVPRLNYNPTNPQDPTLLLEPTSTNLLQRSEDYDNGYWLKARVGSSATGFTAPDGSSNATYYEQASGQTTAAVIYKSGFTSASSGVYTFSIWAKKAEKRYLKLQTRANSATYRTVFDLQDGVITYDSGNENEKIEEYPNGWYRLSVQRTSTTTDDIIVYYYLNDSAVQSDTVTDSGGVYIWGSQVEKTNHLTSYIPTTTAQVTRTADTCKLENFADIPTSYPFTAFVDMDIIEDEKGYGFSILDISSSANYFSVGYSEDGGNLGKFRFTNRAQGTAYNFNTISTYGTGRYKIAVKFISATNLKAFIDGVEIADYTHASSAFNTNINDVLLGQLRVAGDTSDRSPIHQFMIFNEELSDSELQTLTT